MGIALDRIQTQLKQEFEDSKQVLGFEQYFDLVDKNPTDYLRLAPQYVLDAIHHFGNSEHQSPSGTRTRYHAFDNHFSAKPRPIRGHESAQQALVKILTGFARTGRSDKLIVIHGPNGSAKTSLVSALFEALEHYSQSDQGRLFSFSWIFAVDSFEKSLGFGATPKAARESRDLAHVEQESIGAILRSEIHENPILLIPAKHRRELFEGWLSRAPRDQLGRLEASRDAFFRSEISQKNAMIFEALLNDYQGDFRKVLRHVRVERFFLSTSFRKGLVMIQPQFGADAHLRQVTLDRSMANLPAALQSLNLFQLEGDLIDGNRGILLYDDLLKRPLESFKYLLNTIESGAINLGNVVAFLDTIFVATTNDHQLQAFREYPDYNSFKARIEFIRAPYLLKVSDEKSIYDETATSVVGNKELLPHTTYLLALWAVMTRLKKPLIKNKTAALTKLLETITPIEKAKLYDFGEVPKRFSQEERQSLLAHLPELFHEHESLPYYEGLLGASARELKLVLQMAAQNEQSPTLGPNAVFAELRALVKRVSDYEYLRQEASSGYHHFEDFISVCHKEWLDLVDRELWDSCELKDERQIGKMMEVYVHRVMIKNRGEKIKNPVTGKFEDPDQKVLKEFESLLDVTMAEAEEFRQGLISRIGAWSIDHRQSIQPGDKLPLEKIFSDIYARIHQKFFNEQRSHIVAMANALLDSKDVSFLEVENPNSPHTQAQALAATTYRNLQQRYNYGPLGAREVLFEILRERYRS